MAFIVSENANPAQHICYFGLGPEEAKAYLKVEHMQPIEETYVLAFADGGLRGVFGLEFDLELRRAWLEGPLTRSEDWDMIGEKLYQLVISRIPKAINDYELCGSSQNNRLRELALAHGFTPNESDSVVLGLTRPQNLRYPSANPQEFSTEQFLSFNKLHCEIFPNTYYNSKQLLERMNDTQKVFIIGDGKKVHGYICVDIVPDRADAYIHFLGVEPAYRRQGLGEQLLLTALEWVFNNKGVKHIGLSVRTSNTDALGLYQKFGFVVERRLRGYRKRIA
jgi:ribosomal protein S18 acetylase RimI-like enzyme